MTDCRIIGAGKARGASAVAIMDWSRRVEMNLCLATQKSSVDPYYVRILYKGDVYCTLYVRTLIIRLLSTIVYQLHNIYIGHTTLHVISSRVPQYRRFAIINGISYHGKIPL